MRQLGARSPLEKHGRFDQIALVMKEMAKTAPDAASYAPVTSASPAVKA